MDLSHDRFDEYAVAHVLGGLSSDEAAEFRSHLLGCRDCRARVAELRGLADDLAVAAREERANQRSVAVDQRDGLDDPDEEDQDERRLLDRRGRWLLVAGAVGIALLGVLVVWNQALRFDNVTLVGTAAAREEVLASLGDGQSLSVETRAGVSGVAARDVDHEQVALSLGGLVDLAEMNQVVVWRNDGTAEESDWVEHASLDPDQLVAGRLAMLVPVTAATTEVIVTVEQSVMPELPNDFPVFRADLGG